MPRVTPFVYCEHITHEGNDKSNISLQNPQHVFRPEFIPSLFSFGIFFGIIDLDTQDDHTFRFTFTNPQGNVLIDSDTIPMPKVNHNSTNLPPQLRGILMNMEFRNVAFKEEGEYSSEIFVNEESLGRYPIYVHGKDEQE
jgi:hypothetical protein